MNTSAVQIAITEARACAMATLDSGSFVLRELPNVHVDPELLAGVTEPCQRLIATNSDVIPELIEIDDLLHYGGADEALTGAVDLVMGWLSHDLEQMNGLLVELRAAAAVDPERESAQILVLESAMNVLRPYLRAQQVAASIATI